jgi:fatty acid desaturase
MRDQIRMLAQPSISQWLLRVTINWLEITALFYGMFYFRHWATDVLGILLLGTRQHALALLAHEAIHKSISRNKYLNDILGNTLSSLPIFQSLGFFKAFHLNHHAYMLTEKDPEVHVRLKSPKKWGVPLTKWGRWKILITDLSGIGYLDTRHALPFIVPTLKPIDVIAPTVFWTLVITISVKLNAGWIPLYWTIAFVTSYWAMFRQRALTEHIGTDSTHKIIANPLQRFFYLPHNTWYHFEHHINANVPCWNLPKLRALSNEKDFITVNEMFDKLSQTKV